MTVGTCDKNICDDQLSSSFNFQVENRYISFNLVSTILLITIKKCQVPSKLGQGEELLRLPHIYIHKLNNVMN